MITFQELASCLREAFGDVHRTDRATAMLQKFVSENEDVRLSENYRDSLPDDVELLAQTLFLNNLNEATSATLTLLLLKAMKILSRKRVNRTHASRRTLSIVLDQLANAGRNSEITSESANVVLNLCYERRNVQLVLELNGLEKIIKVLSSSHEKAQTNSAGALQSICFQDIGRKAVRDTRCIKRLIYLTTSKNANVRLRAAGALHNISSDSKSIPEIRQLDGIPRLLSLLRNEENEATKGSAAGAIQNLSRETASRLIIRKLGAAKPLLNLLIAADTQSQICAAGALMNLIATDFESSARDRFNRRLADLVSLSSVRSTLNGL